MAPVPESESVVQPSPRRQSGSALAMALNRIRLQLSKAAAKERGVGQGGSQRKLFPYSQLKDLSLDLAWLKSIKFCHGTSSDTPVSTPRPAPSKDARQGRRNPPGSRLRSLHPPRRKSMTPCFNLAPAVPSVPTCPEFVLQAFGRRRRLQQRMGEVLSFDDEVMSGRSKPVPGLHGRPLRLLTCAMA